MKSTLESDLPSVCSLLASTTSKPGESSGIFFWAQQIEFMKLKDAFHKQLSSRVRVMKQGHDIISKYTKQGSSSLNDNSRILFSHDSFRWALENAAHCASEPNAWIHHNFALTPDTSLLQHCMISAFFNQSLVGFCEVAMLPSPQKDHDDDSHFSYYPCIINLVVDSKYRNQGLATRMIQTSLQFIERYWTQASVITLYVDKTNNKALRLYEKEGFIVKQELQDKYYLSKILKKKVSLNQAKDRKASHATG